jgi:4-carboxymuconolactone decarboxylase
MDEKKRYEEGLKVRRAVLGDAHVDRSLARQNDFTAEFQDMITRHAWAEIWTRPGLDLKTRSCMTLSMMIALNRGDEFKLHVRGAINNGLSKDDIKEVILQSAIYCGVPAANTAMHLAQEVLAEMKL